MTRQVLLRFSADIPVARIKTITTNVRKLIFETSSEAPVRGEAPKDFQVSPPPPLLPLFLPVSGRPSLPARFRRRGRVSRQGLASTGERACGARTDPCGVQQDQNTVHCGTVWSFCWLMQPAAARLFLGGFEATRRR